MTSVTSMAVASGQKSGAWLVLAATILWGTTGTAQTFAPAGATPLAVGAVRLAIGGAALLAWAVVRRAFVRGRRWPVVATLTAAICIALYHLCFFAAVARTGVAVGTVVGIGSSPVLAGALAWLLRREPPSLPWALATLLAVSGCALLALGGGGLRMELTGLLLALGAGGSYAMYVIASKELVAVQRPEAVTGVVFALGAGLLTPVFLTQDFGWLAERSGWLVAMHLGVMTMAVAYALFTRGLLTTPVATAVTLTLGEPVTAALLGVVVLHETLSPSGALGIGLVLAGLALLALWPRPMPVRNVIEES